MEMAVFLNIICFEKVRDLSWGLGTYRMNRWTFKTDATVRFGQILSAIELLGMGNFNEYLLLF